MSEHAQLYLVDDEPAVRKALSRLLRSAGYAVTAFGSAKEFMQQHVAAAPGCLVLDVTMPEITGIELQEWLAQTRSPLPIIFITGNGDIPTSVRAMKAGAVDFLTKPVKEADLLRAIEIALRRGRETRQTRAEVNAIQERLTRLTPREREVLEHVVAGQLTKQIAGDLDTGEHTIKVHRARVMEKMGVQSVAELARLAERMGIGRVPPARRPRPVA